MPRPSATCPSAPSREEADRIESARVESRDSCRSARPCPGSLSGTRRAGATSIEDIAFAERVVGVFARAVGEGSAAIQEDGKLIGRHP